MKPNVKKGEGNKLIAIIGDEVTISPLRTQSLDFCWPASENATSAEKPTISSSTKVIMNWYRDHQTKRTSYFQSIPQQSSDFYRARYPGLQRPILPLDYFTKRGNLPSDSLNSIKREAIRSSEGRHNATGIQITLRLRNNWKLRLICVSLNPYCIYISVYLLFIIMQR